MDPSIMSQAPDDTAEWVKWILGTAFTLFTFGTGALASWIHNLSRRIDHLQEKAHEESKAGDDRLWEAIEKLRNEGTAQYERLRTLMEAHHSEAENFRSNIQATMSTKLDVHREVDRVIDEVDRVVDAITSVYSPLERSTQPPRLRRRPGPSDT